MKGLQSIHRCPSGTTLIESVIAIGVLAVAIPMVFGTLAESGKSALFAQTESRSTWMVPVCMDEIQASRDGRSRFFPTTEVGEAFPPEGDVWALGFSQDGKLIGKIPKTLYQNGTREIAGTPVRFIATIASTKPPAQDGGPPLLRVAISLESPAASPVEKRRKLDFHTCIP